MEAVGQLTGGIAHDFNNLLAVDDSKRKLVEPMLHAVERSASLTHRLLAFARRQPLDVRNVDANELLTGLEVLLRRTLRRDNRN